MVEKMVNGDTDVMNYCLYSSNKQPCLLRNVRLSSNIETEKRMNFYGGSIMVANRKSQRMTIEEWRELERNSHDIKHEYIDGYVYAMTGGSRPHSRIGSNTVRAFEDALAIAGMSCYVYNSDMAVRVSESRYTYPDTSVTCDERDRPILEETEIFYPRVVVEVLSESTESYDRGKKFLLYRSCPTLQEYVIVATKYRSVEVYRRTARGWTDYQFYGPGEEIELTSLGIHVPVSSFYLNEGVPETIEEPEGEF